MAEVLGYADPPARQGIVFERRPNEVKIVVLPNRIAGIVTLVISLLLSPFLLLLLLLGGDVMSAYRTIRSAFRPVVIEVSSTTVSLLNIQCGGDVCDFVRPRDKVYEAKYVSHSGNLVIRAKGHDMIDCRPVRDPQLLQWIAAELRQALGMDGGPQEEAIGE